jgi:hypothetical protein
LPVAQATVMSGPRRVVPTIVGLKAVCVAMSLLSGGCAVILQERESEYNAQNSVPQCTASKGWVLLDSLNAAGDAVAILALSRVDSATSPELDEDKTKLMVAFAATGAMYLTSAIIANDWANECQAAREQHEAYVRTLVVSQTRSPMGFFCSGDICYSEQRLCERRLGDDDEACELRQIAYCFSSDRFRVCRSTLAGCEKQYRLGQRGARTRCQESR